MNSRDVIYSVSYYSMSIRTGRKFRRVKTFSDLVSAFSYFCRCSDLRREGLRLSQLLPDGVSLEDD